MSDSVCEVCQSSSCLTNTNHRKIACVIPTKPTITTTETDSLITHVYKVNVTFTLELGKNTDLKELTCVRNRIEGKLNEVQEFLTNDLIEMCKKEIKEL